MTLQEFVGRGWNEHADDPEGVFARLPRGLELLSQPSDAPMLAGLLVHVAGEHLGRWDEGLELLDRMLAHELVTDEPTRRALQRQQAILHECAGRSAEARALLTEGRDPAHPEGSSEARVHAVAASALLGQGRTQEAIAALERSLAAAEYGPSADDPAARALAITCNNMACDLEERPQRSAVEDELLRRAAREARWYWEIAGDWTNVSLAEYRLAKTHLALGEAAVAVRHAEEAVALCASNEAEPADRFFPYEVLAHSLHAAGRAEEARAARDRAAACLIGIADEGLRGSCAEELEKLERCLGAP